ncbi:DUF3293 domain-containing protein [Pseudoalteromonas sp. S16_S37]|uniref:DUF3293 domain-containing protein n=1 Tax=Pseudoalteromonas sp. S16_S37 TaxID=2720228 RepID=UPI001681A1E7|nr:DUF3293 domain-containing protein [Pseudoalteromonas sp. S16_S37]MBD1581984.1 DUF3293 domain-containing protein [Pseudoalteromonas sp. S16_S37]
MPKNSAVISLWNPLGRKHTKKRNNLMAMSSLNELNRAGFSYVGLWGGNKSFSYRELSVMVKVSLDTACKLAKRLNQLAFYYIDTSSCLWLVEVSANKRKRIVCTDIRARFVQVPLPVNNLALKKLSDVHKKAARIENDSFKVRDSKTSSE